MRRFALQVDQLPAWAFVLGAIAVFGTARASRLFALLHQSRGGMELAGIVTLFRRSPLLGASSSAS